MTHDLTNNPIDAVITWVEGNAPAHRAKRARYMARSNDVLSENARNPHRWEQSDEIYFCLYSIHTHAPWIRTIFLVVDDDAPDLSRLPTALRRKIRIVLHKEIFDGFLDVLPTFNSVAIETMLWRIDGLAERFLYFNDDVFLTNPLEPDDVFMCNGPVLRGAWVDYSALIDDPVARADPAKFNHYMLINAAALCGYSAARLFACAHVVHPLQRSVMKLLFDEHRDAFVSNIGYRFRNLSQFSPQGAHTHASLPNVENALCEADDHLHITSGQGTGQPADQTRALLTPEALRGIKFLCVNDLPQLEALLPDARGLIAHAVGMDPLP